MNRANNIQVLITGAGPTGLTLACDLARRGVTCRIVEKALAYPTGSRGKGMQPRSLEVLDDLGVVDQILANGRFHLPFRAYDGAMVLGDGDMHEGRQPTPDVPYASTLVVPQWRVEQILRDQLATYGIHVELATELTAFAQDADGVMATLVHEGINEQIRVAYLVGCDGGHSFVRKALGIGFEGETWESQRMLLGDVHLDGLDRDYWHVWPKSKAGVLALCPLPGTDVFQLQAQIAPDESTELSLEHFQAMVTARTERSDIRLHDATWLSFYRVNIRMVDRYQVGRVFLAGDAAHVHSPAGGQGMNTGIQDAYNLGWKLGQVLAGAPVALLATYEAERLPIAAWLLGITTKLHGQTFQTNPNIARRGPETLQLELHYRDSALTHDERKAPASVQAGDRAPDAPCHNAAGKPIRLFDLFRGPHFTLLAFGLEHSAIVAEINERYGDWVRGYTIISINQPADGASLIDIDGHAYQAYGIEPDTLVLVRPDGYIGLITQAQSVESICDYLCHVAAPVGHMAR